MTENDYLHEVRYGATVREAELIERGMAVAVDMLWDANMREAGDLVIAEVLARKTKRAEEKGFRTRPQ